MKSWDCHSSLTKWVIISKFSCCSLLLHYNDLNFLYLGMNCNEILFCYFLTCFLVPHMLGAYFSVYWVTVFFEIILLDWTTMFMIISVCSEQINKRQDIRRRRNKSCEQFRSQALFWHRLRLCSQVWVLTKLRYCQGSNLSPAQHTLTERPFQPGESQGLIQKFADKLVLFRGQCWESLCNEEAPPAPNVLLGFRRAIKGFGGC